MERELYLLFNFTKVFGCFFLTEELELQQFIEQNSCSVHQKVNTGRRGSFRNTKTAFKSNFP